MIFCQNTFTPLWGTWMLWEYLPSAERARSPSCIVKQFLIRRPDLWNSCFPEPTRAIRPQYRSFQYFRKSFQTKQISMFTRVWLITPISVKIYPWLCIFTPRLWVFTQLNNPLMEEELVVISRSCCILRKDAFLLFHTLLHQPLGSRCTSLSCEICAEGAQVVDCGPAAAATFLILKSGSLVDGSRQLFWTPQCFF